MNRNRTRAALLVACLLGLASVALAQALPSITPGAPAQTVQVPMSPTLSFTIAAASEVQIDAVGAPMDAQLALVQGSSILQQDSDSGDGVDARIVTFLAPGTYGARVSEYQGRAMTARVGVTVLAPMTAAATVTPGAPATVVRTPAGDGARAASVELTLNVATAGTYRIDVVSPDGSVDPELTLIQHAAIVASDSDSGEGTNAQLVRALTPGAYTLRVRDWSNRAAALTVTVTRP